MLMIAHVMNTRYTIVRALSNPPHLILAFRYQLSDKISCPNPLQSVPHITPNIPCIYEHQE